MTQRKLANWLEGYREYTAGTESPATFHLWVALGTIAAAAQRKISMDAGYFDNVFLREPNLGKGSFARQTL